MAQGPLITTYVIASRRVLVTCRAVSCRITVRPPMPSCSSCPPSNASTYHPYRTPARQHARVIVRSSCRVAFRSWMAQRGGWDGMGGYCESTLPSPNDKSPLSFSLLPFFSFFVLVLLSLLLAASTDNYKQNRQIPLRLNFRGGGRRAEADI